MNLETWWDNSDWGHSTYSEKNVPVALFHYKSHIEWPRIEPIPLQWDTTTSAKARLLIAVFTLNQVIYYIIIVYKEYVCLHACVQASTLKGWSTFYFSWSPFFIHPILSLPVHYIFRSEKTAQILMSGLWGGQTWLQWLCSAKCEPSFCTKCFMQQVKNISCTWLAIILQKLQVTDRLLLQLISTLCRGRGGGEVVDLTFHVVLRIFQLI